ncbi:MAG: tyrosine-type recombinase/integrase [Rhodobacteraceae bacterium]|jgi:integrase|nr:tyrosine-type recombinase/integrase [Paracoccaceae bacterium]
MTRRRNPFPGVARTVDRHGKVRWRFRKRGFSAYLPGPYGSPEFRAAYEVAVEGSRTPNRSKAAHGTFAWLIELYLESPRFKNLSDSRRKSLRGLLDWLRGEVGDLPFARFGTRHVEAVMAKKAGPVAANNVKKTLSLLFNFAVARELGVTHNPARYAERMRERGDGYHTWTDAEIDRFLNWHGASTKARLVMLLALNTGMSRQDLTRVGWQNVSGGRIAYRRGKTGVGADLPILAELADELANVPTGQMLFVTHGPRKPYKPETLGNWFGDRCAEAGVPGSLHGLRKAGATRLANAGATPDEIRAFLAHSTNSQGAVYTRQADRARLADSGMAKLSGREGERKLSNLSARLDKGGV